LEVKQLRFDVEVFSGLLGGELFTLEELLDEFGQDMGGDANLGGIFRRLSFLAKLITDEASAEQNRVNKVNIIAINFDLVFGLFHGVPLFLVGLL